MIEALGRGRAMSPDGIPALSHVMPFGSPISRHEIREVVQHDR
jgi:hypothetical protein